MKMRIKVVPNNDPNADGNWTTWSIPGKVVQGLYSSDPKIRHEASHKIYGELGPKGHHIVAFCQTKGMRHRTNDLVKREFQRRKDMGNRITLKGLRQPGASMLRQLLQE